MFKKSLIIILGVLLAGTTAFSAKYLVDRENSTKEVISPLAEKIEKITAKKEPLSALETKEVMNILLIGIDRRSKFQQGFNTDTMVLVSVCPETNKVLLTSVPRDLWINGNKINALFAVYGWETLKDAFEKIVGMELDGYIYTDFEDFTWIIDSFGGVPVDVERTFTDNTFPNNTDTDIVSVTFYEGYEKMTGERALTFARSRKGNNGEGSDLMRTKRQHLILQGMIEAVKQPESIFWPMDIENFYNTVTNARMVTTLGVKDAKYLWDFYKDKNDYSIESFVVGDSYVYHPGMYPESEFRAWVFIPIEDNFATLHRDIEIKLGLREPNVELQEQPDHDSPTDL